MLDAYVFAIMSPQNDKLAPSCQNQGKNEVKLKGDPTFHLLTPVAKVTR